MCHPLSCHDIMWPPKGLAVLITLTVWLLAVAPVRVCAQKTHTRQVRLRGDLQVIEFLPSWPATRTQLEQKIKTREEAQELIDRLNAELEICGYVFDQVQLAEFAEDGSHITLVGKAARIGSLGLTGNRWWTAKEIAERLSWDAGERFDYRAFYAGFFKLNKNRDVQADVEIAPKENDDGSRVVNAQLKVTDRIPVHAALKVDNTGPKETGDWRVQTTLQHTNLTRHDDRLTIDWRTDPQEMAAVTAVSSSYVLGFGDGWTFSAFGGWSESDLENVLPELQLVGDSRSAGLRLQRTMDVAPLGSLALGMGWVYQHVNSENSFAGSTVADDSYELSMPLLNVSITPEHADPLGGKSLLAGTLLANWSDVAGASDEGDFEDAGGVSFADDDFLVSRVHFSRVQPLPFGRNGQPWTLSLRVAAQYSDSNVPSALATSIGGADTVRGYHERELHGDSGFSTSIELRSPPVSGPVPRLLLFGSGAEPTGSLQFLAFIDAGQVHSNDTAAGVDASEAISSAGVGVRFEVTRFLQMKVDVGVPFDRTEGAARRPRGHVGLLLRY